VLDALKITKPTVHWSGYTRSGSFGANWESDDASVYDMVHMASVMESDYLGTSSSVTNIILSSMGRYSSSYFLGGNWYWGMTLHGDSFFISEMGMCSNIDFSLSLYIKPDNSPSQYAAQYAYPNPPDQGGYGNPYDDQGYNWTSNVFNFVGSYDAVLGQITSPEIFNCDSVPAWPDHDFIWPSDLWTWVPSPVYLHSIYKGCQIQAAGVKTFATWNFQYCTNKYW
jgi:hypothetical protein